MNTRIGWSFGISGILIAFFSWYSGVNYSFSLYWFNLLFSFSKAFGVYLVGFLVVYLLVSLTLIAFGLEEKKILHIFAVIWYIVVFAFSLMVLGILTALLLTTLAKRMQEKIAFLISYALIIFLLTVIRNKIKDKKGVDIYNIWAFLK